MAKVTLATIAQRTGLSKFAVSRALSGKDGVSEETRRRVQEAAAALGYARPDTGPLTLGVIFHDADLINSELHLLIQNGAQSEAQRLGYRLNMRWTHEPEEIQAIVRACSGAVFVGPHGRESFAAAYALGKPIVRQGWLEPLEQADHIGGTDHEAGAAVANYLVALGHRRIAYVHGAPGYRGRVERFYGVREVLEKQDDVEFREMKFDAEIRFTEHLRAAHAEGFRPTAFFCAHDGLALTVMSELLRLGYRIPEDASVVGFGDYSAATQISPQLTTVKVYGQQIGAACVRLLDDRINGRIPPDIPVRVQITSRIVERASCGPRKVDDGVMPRRRAP
ncbi:LacI family DNA-binding transcriptional regulator [Inquilinus sp. NPDC058860]|uniref:LacI family DNA-binding transcriptional regulator n=1 Tax=Inquilinus sp. NPDC058860 TaxID=3346652 RepID=UPI003676D903